MTRLIRTLRTDSEGAAAIEFAIAVPVLTVMIWGMFQIGLIFQANAGMQHSLGEAARYATIFPTPTDTQLQNRITARKFGLGNGTWGTPTIATDAAAGTKTITVTYSQPTDFLLFSGPTVTMTKSKVVYISD
jgi:Flp pilus assembly protein TadG